MVPKAPPVSVVTPNADGIQTRTVVINQANRPIQLPSMDIPDGFPVVVKAWPNPPNTGRIYVAESKAYCLDINYVTPLRPGEFVSYYVKNASSIWISGTVAGDRVTITSEKNQD